MSLFNKRHSLLFYRYLISYMLIFSIPFITISIIFYYMSINNLKNEIIQSNTSKLEQVMDFTNSWTYEFKNIATRISYDSRLTPYMLKQPSTGVEAINQLSSFQVNSSIIDNIYLIYHDEDITFSSKGESTFDVAMGKSNQIKDIESLRETMKALSTPEVLRVKTGHRYNIVYLYPIPLNHTAPYGTVAFFIKEETMKRWIQNILGDFTGSTYVFSDTGETLVTSNVGKQLSAEEISHFDLGKSGITEKKINQENYSLVTVHSEETNWTFVTAMPTAQFYEKMSAMKTTLLFMLISIAMIGIGMTVFISFKQYKPIRGLSQMLKRKRPLDDSLPERQMDEFAKMRETLEFIFEDSENLRKKVDLQQPFVKDQILIGLLRNNLTLDVGLSNFNDNFQIHFTGNHFFVMMIALNEKIDSHSIENREALINYLTEIKAKDCKGYGIELIQENAFVLIVSMPEYSEEKRKNFAHHMTENITTLFAIKPAIGVGKTYQGMNQIKKSFIEAAAVLEYNSLNTQSYLHFFEEISSENQNTYWYPLDYQVQLIQSLKQGNDNVAMESLRNILQNMRSKNIPPYLLRSMCFDIINTFLKHIAEFDLPVNANHIHQLVEFTTVDDLEEKLDLMVTDICNHVEKRKESNNDHLRNEIMAYIHRHYKDNELSLAKVAEEFQLSVSYLSRFIKGQTGFTFTQFVWELRKKECKRQLQETDRLIKDIVYDIGYLDVANFTRKFKGEEGLTPGQYRERYFYQNEA